MKKNYRLIIFILTFLILSMSTYAYIAPLKPTAPIMTLQETTPTQLVSGEKSMDWGFFPPTPSEEVFNHNYIEFNIGVLEKCTTEQGGLKIEMNGVNRSVCTNCPFTVPGFVTYNWTGLNDGNKSYSFWCNNQKKTSSWTYLDTGKNAYAKQISPEDNYHWEDPAQPITLSCEAYSPSGIESITLRGDFYNIKYEMLYTDTFMVPGNQTNYTANFQVEGIDINDSYIWNCEAQSKGGYKIYSDQNYTLNVGRGIVYVIHAIDTESNNRESQDHKFFMDLDFSNYIINNFNNYGDPDNGVTIQTFDQDTRRLYTDSFNNPFKLTWYLMTHEAHCHAKDSSGMLPNPVGCDIIAEIMYGNKSSILYSYGGTYRNEITRWGDGIGWHNHHSYWSGESTSDSAGEWIGDSLSEFSFDGSSLFWYNTSNTTLTETDYVRAKKLASEFSYNYNLPWTSYRAGWLVINNAYNGFLEKITALDFTNTPLPAGNMWKPQIYKSGTDRLIGFRCSPGAPSQAIMDNGFYYAQNGQRVVVCGYSHNYLGIVLISDTANIWNRATQSSSNYGVDFKYVTDLEAAQAFFRITDTTPPTLQTEIIENNLYVYSDEELYSPPVLNIRLNDGLTTNYSLEYMSEINKTAFVFDISSYENRILGIVVRATDKHFNTASKKVSLFQQGLAVCGDMNYDKKVNVMDIIYLINYKFKNGPDPVPLVQLGDVDGSGRINILDIIYLINYKYKEGPAPVGQFGLCNSPAPSEPTEEGDLQTIIEYLQNV